MDPSDRDRYGRIEGLLDRPALITKRVTLIGCGSMGNPIALQLARHGVATHGAGRLRLIDGDLVTLRNLIGTEFRQAHLGMPKAEATANLVREPRHQSSGRSVRSRASESRNQRGSL